MAQENGGEDRRMMQVVPARPGRHVALAVPLAAILLIGAAAGPVARAARPAEANAAAQLAARLGALLGPAALPEDAVSAAVVPVSRHPTVAAGLDPGMRLEPGATAALYADAVALADVGPGHTVPTVLFGQSPPSRGTEHGNLYLVGGGDFSLSGAALASLARTVAARVHVVTGALVVDARLFGPASPPAGWTADLARDPFAVVPTALTVDGGQITVTVRPARPGRWAFVSQAPANAFRVVGRIRTVAKAPTQIHVSVPPYGQTLTVSGQVAARAAPRTYLLAAPDAAMVAGRVLLADLVSDGVAVRDGLRAGALPRGARALARHASASVDGLVIAQLHTGSVGYAESLLRLAGLRVPAAPSPAAGGVAAIDRLALSLGVRPGPVLEDGSGTSREDQTSAQTLAQFLAAAYATPWGKDLAAALPKLSRSPFGRVSAVAGVAPGVAALAGYARGRNGQMLAFAYLANGQGGARPLSAEDAAADALAYWPGPIPGPPLPPNAAPPPPPPWTARLRDALSLFGKGSDVAVELVNMATGRVMWQRGASVEMPSPGIEAALTGAAARQLLPADAVLDTRLLMVGHLSGTAVDGSLALVGNADPSLSLASLESLAAQVHALGIRSVTGGVTVTEPRSGPAAYGDGWPVEEETLPGAAPIDTLSVGGDQVSVAVLPAARAGMPPSAVVVPLGSGLTVEDGARTVAGRADTLRLAWDPGTSRFILSGTIGVSRTGGAVFLRTAPDPALLAGNLLIGALRADHVSVGASSAARGGTPGARAAVVAQVQSATLASLADQQLAAPSPLAAEDLLAVLGGTANAKTATAGTAAEGLARLRRFVARAAAGAPPPELFDGAGLSLYDRMAPAAVVTAFDRLATRPALAQLPDTLPLAASGSGGGWVRAVTGVAPGEAALAGYVTTASGGRIAVSVQAGSLTLTPARTEAALTAVAQALRILPVVGTVRAKGAAAR
jgi:D-alanyl-D-alanine carboxypeptidase/D-alanyl-D-alanine-endopeptidase (penicillin-binding protein 4)